MGFRSRQLLAVALALGVVIPQANAKPCACRGGSAEASPEVPRCCAANQPAAASDGRCVKSSTAGCCGATPGACECEGCGGPRPADPLAAASAEIAPSEFSMPLATPPAPLTDDCRQALADRLTTLVATPPPDLQSLLCVWTL